MHRSVTYTIVALSVAWLTSIHAAFAQPRLATEPVTTVTPFERDTTHSASYPEALAYYRTLASLHPEYARLYEIGTTDAGRPLQLFVIGRNLPRFSLNAFASDVPGTNLNAGVVGRPTFFVNNAIHAGEPCGVDASMLFARQLLENDLTGFPERGIVAVIPAYNIGGMLRRGQDTRVNQDGPAAHGFRGNARNLDLNRDFAKQDSRNAQAITRLLRQLSPDVFLDTHTTNGSDHQYDLTVLATQPDKLGPVLGPYLRDTLLPRLERGMTARGFRTSPYFYTSGPPQETSLMPFVETPRYSSGYTALLHSIGIITEAHALKPFARRVRATEAFLHEAFTAWTDDHDRIAARRRQNRVAIHAQDSITLAWRVDSTRADTLSFLGYEPVRTTSTVTGFERLRYDRTRPTSSRVVRYAYLQPAVRVPLPRAYFVPERHGDLVRQLIDYEPVLYVAEDQAPAPTLTTYQISDYDTGTRPYEGHYLHFDVEVETMRQRTSLSELGYLLEVTPENARLLTALLEPQAPDSYFAWGVFDSYLQQKEYFSDYLFEDVAAKLLTHDETLREEFSRKREEEEAFRQNPRWQLDWLYRRSPYYEGAPRYPVIRVERE